MEPLRDRIFGLLSDLCGEQHEVSPDGLRLLSHTILGVARDHAPSALFAVREALPYIAALVETSDGADAIAVADMLARRGIIRALTRDGVARRLEGAARPEDALREIAALDARLHALSTRPAQPLRDEVIGDSELLAATAELLSGGASETRARFAAAMELRPAPRADAALAVLASVQDGSLDGGFCERTRRFEAAAADHLQRFGLLVAVRAALAFEPRGSFASFSVFAANPALDALAVALASMRGAVFAHRSGEVARRALDPWVEYLRGPCRALAAQHAVSAREATSFAHFCLHLMNFCDLAATGDGDDAMRLAMMQVEDELRDVALEKAGAKPRPPIEQPSATPEPRNAELEALTLLARSEETPLELRALAQRRIAGILGEDGVRAEPMPALELGM